MSHFFSIDVETANASLSSICQIGIVEFRDGSEVWCASWLVDPHDYFDEVNVSIHGITADQVRGAPTFCEVATELCERVGGAVVVCHTHFDRVAMSQACAKGGIDAMGCRWLDSARVARRTWSDFARSGYGLANIAAYLGIHFRHHDALEDARAAGTILLRAMSETNQSVEDWLVGVERPITHSQPIAKEGSPDGLLGGERIVFTGQLYIPRREAAEMADVLGAAVDPGVTKKTTMLIVRDQDILRLNGAEKSGKHRKAEDLIAKGQPIRILCEADWKELHAVGTEMVSPQVRLNS